MTTNDLNIECPECGHHFELTETLAAPLVAAQRDKAIKHFNLLKAEMAKRESELKKREATLSDVDAVVAQQLAEAKAVIQTQASEVARKEFALQLAESEAERERQAKKLQAAEQAELQARRLKREAEEAKRTAELEVERRMDKERESVRKAALKEGEQENRLRLAEKEQQLKVMRDQIEELRRKGNSGSQQLQGDVQEMDLADILETAFPGDSFTRVKKGQTGGDVIHRVMGPGGVASGSILWEAKRTKTYSAKWLPKLRDDQGAAKVDIAVLMSGALPDDIDQFDYRERVWICAPPSVLPLAAALRQGLIETNRARRAMQSSDSRKDQIFEYLTGSEFRSRIGGIVDAYSGMREGLDTERRSAHRQWSAREKQLERLLINAAGMFGDLQGIAGASIQQVEGLEILPSESDGEKPRLVVGSDVLADETDNTKDAGE